MFSIASNTMRFQLEDLNIDDDDDIDTSQYTCFGGVVLLTFLFGFIMAYIGALLFARNVLITSVFMVS